MEKDYTKFYIVYILLNICLICILLFTTTCRENSNTQISKEKSPKGIIIDNLEFVPEKYYDSNQKQKKSNNEQDDTNKETQQEESQHPDKSLAKIIYSGAPNSKQVAITFDDGPDPRTLDETLDILEKYNATATFFLLGQKAKDSEHLVEKIHQRGHQVANHSYSHPNFTTLSWQEKEWQIQETDKILADYQSHKYFRPPYGSYDKDTLQLAYQLEYKVIYWNVDPRDWEADDPNQVISRVKNQTKPGSIILLHEGKKVTLEALPHLLEWLQSEGYTFVTVAELIE